MTSNGQLRGSAVLAVFLAGWSMACGPSPTSPSAVDVPGGDVSSALTANIGPGAGAVSITLVSNPERKLDMIVKVRVQGALPNTTYIVQRAGESDRVNSADGVCQRANGVPPWSPSDPPVNFLFPSFRMPDPTGPEISFTTQANGNGSIDFEFLHSTFAAGVPFDVMVRLVNDVRGAGDRDAGRGATSELRSACFTVTGK
jgi:hypothetical protein